MTELFVGYSYLLLDFHSVTCVCSDFVGGRNEYVQCLRVFFHCVATWKFKEFNQGLFTRIDFHQFLIHLILLLFGITNSKMVDETLLPCIWMTMVEKKPFLAIICVCACFNDS